MPDPLDDDTLDALNDLEDDEDDIRNNPPWEFQWGCCCPDRCLVIGDHQLGDCITTDGAADYDRAMEDARERPGSSRGIW